MKTVKDKREAVLDEHTRRFIASTEGFYERYISNLAFFDTNKAAYEATERQFSFVTGRRKFKNHDVFKAAYSRHCRNKHPR